MIAQCPNAARNPHTGEPVGKQVVYDILERLCYDVDPSHPWVHQARAARTALGPEDISRRLRLGQQMESLSHTPACYSRHIVWTDICNDVLPLTIRKANDQARARKGSHGWISPGSEMDSSNMRGKKEDLRLAGAKMCCFSTSWRTCEVVHLGRYRSFGGGGVLWRPR